MSNEKIWLPTAEDIEILELYAMGLFRISYPDAQDLIQEAFINYWKRHSISGAKMPLNPEHYFKIVMKNVFIDKLRKEKITSKQLKSVVGFENHFNELVRFEEDDFNIESYLKFLRPSAQKVIRLFLENGSVNEISQETGFSQSKIRSILRKNRDLGKLIEFVKVDINK